MRWPDGWQKIDAQTAEALQAELKRETCPEHPLYGQECKAIARLKGRDDVLFVMCGPKCRYAQVQLTWNVESDPKFPLTTIHASLEGWSSWEEWLAQWNG